MDRIKGDCAERCPKATVELLSSQVGGITGASAPGELPRDEKQVTNMKRREKGKRQGCQRFPNIRYGAIFYVKFRIWNSHSRSNILPRGIGRDPYYLPSFASCNKEK